MLILLKIYFINYESRGSLLNVIASLHMNAEDDRQARLLKQAHQLSR